MTSPITADIICSQDVYIANNYFVSEKHFLNPIFRIILTCSYSGTHILYVVRWSMDEIIILYNTSCVQTRSCVQLQLCVYIYSRLYFMAVDIIFFSFLLSFVFPIENNVLFSECTDPILIAGSFFLSRKRARISQELYGCAYSI